MSKRMWIIILIVVVGSIGIVWMDDSEDHGPIGADTGARTTHIIGKQDSKVTLVEYSDFQCPACGAYYPVVEQIIEKYKDRISFEYRHYPLPTIHRNAFAAARASEAASMQGKFWEMYRMLFTNQHTWENSASTQPTFEGYAKRLGLDVAEFRIDFASRDTNSAINASIAEFNTRGLPKATPTFLLNGKKIGARSVEDFSQLIDDRLE